MKKLLLSMLVVSFLLATLTACGAEAKQPDEPAPQEETIQAEKNEPLAEQNDNQELSGAALEEYFQLAYDACLGSKSSSDEQISFEIEMIESFCYTDKEVLPSDYADQYRAWRPGTIIQTTEDEAPQTSVAALTFHDVNETVYATSQVNICSNPSTDAEKLASLAGGNSITRTGIGTGDYSSWSRVQLSDGTIAYISSNYLSTTKPTNTNSSGSGSTGTTEGGKGTPSEGDNYIPPAGTSYTYDDTGFHGIVDLTQVDSFGTMAGEFDYEGTLSDTAPESKKGSTPQSEDGNYTPPSGTSYTYDEKGFHGIVDLTDLEAGTIAGDGIYEGTLSDTAP